jgi:DDE domain
MGDAERVQGTSLSCRFHPAMRALVPEVQRQLSASGGNDAGARLRSSSHDQLDRWIQTYAPQLEKPIRWYQGHAGCSWRADETCIKVCGECLYLFRAIDSRGRTIDFYLSRCVMPEQPDAAWPRLCEHVATGHLRSPIRIAIRPMAKPFGSGKIPSCWTTPSITAK